MSDETGIAGYPLYIVSRQGEVFSLISGTRKQLKGVRVQNGYLHVTIGNDNGRKQTLVHRLVAEAFLPNPDGLLQVNHKNGIKTDNRVENLEWCTQSHNVKHGYQCGLRVIDDAHKARAAGLGRAKRKLDIHQAEKIRLSYTGARGDITKLSMEYGIDRKGIRSIIKGTAYQLEEV